jgi:hypothetical protein
MEQQLGKLPANVFEKKNQNIVTGPPGIEFEIGNIGQIQSEKKPVDQHKKHLD